jgi:hypothetical protein
VPVLTAIDLLGIQEFIFGSNRLRDAVAASQAIRLICSDDSEGWLAELKGPGSILLSGGGNALLEFPDLAGAHRFAASFSRRLYDHLPALGAVIVHRAFQPGSLAEAIDRVYTDAAVAKTQRLDGPATQGWGVTAACARTGQVATGTDPDDGSQPVSATLRELQSFLPSANRRWERFLPTEPEALAFPLELDHLGRSTGERSFLAVVHIDGNRIGAKISKWLKGAATRGLSDAKVKQAYRDWSSALDRIGEQALAAIVQRVSQHLLRAEDKVLMTGAIPQLNFALHRAKDRVYLPLRPLILGGDDLTYVCDGRLAWATARVALEAFANATVPYLGTIGACAGLALVKTHSPFSRAYALAEHLCRSAKRALQADGASDDLALDWHIGGGGDFDDLESYRQRTYRSGSFSLTCRPYRCSPHQGSTLDWPWVADTLLGTYEFSFHGPVWRTRRHKIKELAEVVRQGPEGVRQAFDAWRVSVPNLRLPPPIEQGFCDKNRTPLLDAIELLDLCQHLPGRNTHQAAAPGGR